jgi:DNA-binding CsgD family transcriptional regulator
MLLMWSIPTGAWRSAVLRQKTRSGTTEKRWRRGPALLTEDRLTGSPLLHKDRSTEPRAAEEAVSVLVRALLACALTECEPEADDVVLDVEVDGFRCVLVHVPPRPEPAHVPLSPREQEIARMVAQGYPNKTIAAVLDISSWTVSTHLRRIFAKLAVRSRAAMVARIVEEEMLGAQVPLSHPETASLHPAQGEQLTQPVWQEPGRR